MTWSNFYGPVARCKNINTKIEENSSFFFSRIMPFLRSREQKKMGIIMIIRIDSSLFLNKNGGIWEPPIKEVVFLPSL